MIRLLLVEDEAPIRKGMLRHIPFAELDIGEIQSAGSADEALSMDYEPDIILSDIRMPRMSGIALCGIYRERFRDCQIIFISGHADKEYLKKAIELGALGYLEKPLDLEKIGDLLKKAVARVRENRSKNRVFLHHLLFQPPEQLLPSPEEREGASGVFLLLLLRTKEELVSVFSLADALSKKSGASLEAAPLSGNLYAFLARNEEGWEKEEVYSLCTLLFSLRLKEEQWFLSVSRPIDGGIQPVIEHLREEYRRAWDRLDCLSYLSWNGTVFSEEIPRHQAFRLSEQEEEALYRALMEKNEESSLAVVRRFCKEAKKEKVLLHFPLRESFYRMNRIIGRAGGEGEREEDSYRFLEEAASIDEIEDYLCGLIQDALESRRANASHYIIKEVLEYIDGHLTDSSVTTASLAEIACLSPTYLSALFRKKTGKTISEYILEKRILLACRLLKNPGMKLYEIAGAVGYEDAKYFAKIFKKRMGVTPSEFREG